MHDKTCRITLHILTDMKQVTGNFRLGMIRHISSILEYFAFQSDLVEINAT
jgi:hypothetical protein